MPLYQSYSGLITGNIPWYPTLKLPNFYSNYSAKYNKPFAVPQTAAFYNLCDKNKTAYGCNLNANGPSQKELKEAWWEQVYSVSDGTYGPSIPSKFPNLKLVTWYDAVVQQPEAGGNTVDWSFSKDKSLRTAFIAFVYSPYYGTSSKAGRYWLFGPDFRAQVPLPKVATSPPPKPKRPPPRKSPSRKSPPPKPKTTG